MLAQNFMTAADLGLADDIRGALIQVLGMLERGELVHEPPNEFLTFEPSRPNGFNMACSGASNGCGTVACIGGWVAKLTGRGMSSYVNYGDHPSELIRLYWDAADNGVTTAQAAAALRNYLTTGTPSWREVLSA